MFFFQIRIGVYIRKILYFLEAPLTHPKLKPNKILLLLSMPSKTKDNMPTQQWLSGSQGNKYEQLDILGCHPVTLVILVPVISSNWTVCS